MKSPIKKIHYCWFGSKVPVGIEENVKKWELLNPGYEIKLWNENNSIFHDSPYAGRALAEKKWAFLSDIVRLKVLLSEGGWYLDTDIELIQPFDELMLSGDRLVLGYMYDCALGTAVMYSPPNHPYLQRILDKTNLVRSGVWLVNNSIFTEFFINEVSSFLLTGEFWENNEVVIYPRTQFEQPSFFRNSTTALHHFSNSWLLEKNNERRILKKLRACHLLRWLSRIRRNYEQLQINEFRFCYRAALRGEQLPFNTNHYYSND